MDQSNPKVVSLDKAKIEVDSWLDYKKVSDSRRDDRAEQIKTITYAISEGWLWLNEDKSFTQKLKFPFGKDTNFEEIKYLPRIPIDNIHMQLRAVKSDDADGRLLCHVSALTNMPRAILSKMDSDDYIVAQAIAYFFL